jgi:hypothetical protein
MGSNRVLLLVLSSPQVQVIAGQTFEVEWVNGHGDIDKTPFYFAIVPMEAFRNLALPNVRQGDATRTHRCGNEMMRAHSMMCALIGGRAPSAPLRLTSRRADNGHHEGVHRPRARERRYPSEAR